MAGKSKKKTAKTSAKVAHKAPSKLIDARTQDLDDWRGRTLARVRALIKQADPEVVEEVKWRKPSNAMLGVPVWSHDGIVCTGETYKDKVKFTFGRGAALEDPAGLFNAGLEGNVRRAIDLHEGDEIDERAFKSLVRAAAALNASSASSRRMSNKAKRKAAAAKLKLLSGGNPRIAKADGGAPAEAYIAAMPGWKSAVGRRLDGLIVRTVPDVRKAVRWKMSVLSRSGDEIAIYAVGKVRRRACAPRSSSSRSPDLEEPTTGDTSWH